MQPMHKLPWINAVICLFGAGPTASSTVEWDWLIPIEQSGWLKMTDMKLEDKIYIVLKYITSVVTIEIVNTI